VAVKYFRTALEVNPKQPRALIEMAKLSYNAGRTVSARAFIQRYFDVGEDTPEVLLFATKIESTLGNRDAEASYAIRLRGKFPDSAEAAQLKADKGVSGKGGGKVQR
jgi:type IV pilus assembly protein PilF